MLSRVLCGEGVEAAGGGSIGLLVGSSIFLIVLATQAASRLRMNSKPSLEIKVTKGEGAFDMVRSGCCRTGTK